MTENRFNLIDEAWIPVADHGRVSLGDLFKKREYRSLGGNPVQKIAILKLLLAIAQSATTPHDEQEWRSIGRDGVGKRCLDYLEKWRDRFFLYGDRPFLQMPGVSLAKVKGFGAMMPEVASGNTTVLKQTEISDTLTDAEKTMLVLTLMGFALGGKKTDNTLVLTKGYEGKKPSGKYGPSVGFIGFLHNFIITDSILETIWLNLLSETLVEKIKIFPAGVGVAPWEEMPEGEDCKTARRLKESLTGRLLPLCRFCLLTDGGMHYTEGISHDGYKEGKFDPSIAVNYSGKVPKALWVNPEKRPFRELTSLLAFMGHEGGGGYNCLQTRIGIERARDVVSQFTLWSGGLRISSNAGEQYATGSDDFVQSSTLLASDCLGEIWFTQLKVEMDGLDRLAKGLYGSVLSYCKALKKDGKEAAGKATGLFWQFVERDFQKLIDNCDEGEQSAKQRRYLRLRFANTYANRAYDLHCPNDTARQLAAWAECQPYHGKYLKMEK